MINPELKNLIKQDIQEGAMFSDILGAVLDVFNEIADKNPRSSGGARIFKENQKEVAAVTATALYKAEELGV